MVLAALVIMSNHTERTTRQVQPPIAGSWGASHAGAQRIKLFAYRLRGFSIALVACYL